mmetsp:Transcript_900/g.2842  ORF Transcript_900/g.2842 Transcript_900/m.2842 type:complete len:217 (+) Transcript_900:1019-1669(+)
MSAPSHPLRSFSFSSRRMCQDLSIRLPSTRLPPASVPRRAPGQRAVRRWRSLLRDDDNRHARLHLGVELDGGNVAARRTDRRQVNHLLVDRHARPIRDHLGDLGRRHAAKQLAIGARLPHHRERTAGADGVDGRSLILAARKARRVLRRSHLALRLRLCEQLGRGLVRKFVRLQVVAEVGLLDRHDLTLLAQVLHICDEDHLPHRVLLKLPLHLDR